MFNNQIEQLMEAQKKQLEPVIKWNAFAAQAFEKVARKNYEVAGDYLNYMVEQSSVPSQDKPAQEIVADLVDGNRAFSEKLAKRTAEYVELSKEISALAPTQELNDFAPVAKKAAPAAASKKAAA